MVRLLDKTKPKGQVQVLPLAAVFITSAYWHGFYFGYYAFFTGVFLMDLAWKTVPKTQLAQSALRVLPQPVVFFVNWYLCFCAISYFGMPYCFYLFHPTMQMWDNFYYLGHWGTIAVIIIASLLPKAQKATKATEGAGPELSKKTQ